MVNLLHLDICALVALISFCRSIKFRHELNLLIVGLIDVLFYVHGKQSRACLRRCNLMENC